MRSICGDGASVSVFSSIVCSASVREESERGYFLSELISLSIPPSELVMQREFSDLECNSVLYSDPSLFI